MSIFVGTTKTIIIDDKLCSQPGIYNENSNPDGQTYQPDVSLNLNMRVAGNTIRNNTPVVFPYGFQSIPYDNLTCIHTGPPNFTSSVVLGHLNSSYNQSNAKELQVGESEIFNKSNYAFRLELTRILAKWVNTDDDENKECKIAIGDNVVNLLVEIYAQMQAYIDAMNDQWQQKFNAHTHSYNPGNNPATETAATTISFHTQDYTPRENFTHLKDDELKDGTTCYIDDHGKIYTNT